MLNFNLKKMSAPIIHQKNCKCSICRNERKKKRSFLYSFPEEKKQAIIQFYKSQKDNQIESIAEFFQISKYQVNKIIEMYIKSTKDRLIITNKNK